MESFPDQPTSFYLPGPAGKLEVLTTSQKNENAKGVAIVCHPHPLYQGTMHNKVVTTLARTFQELKLNTIRFNFRGVGQSEGSYGEGKGELEDLLTIAAWIKTVYPHLPVWLSGFSFGAFIATCAAAKIMPVQLVTVGLPVSYLKEWPAIPSIPCPWLVVHGEQDELTPIAEVSHWIENIKPHPQLIIIQDASHFFHRKLIELRQQIRAVLSNKAE